MSEDCTFSANWVMKFPFQECLQKNKVLDFKRTGPEVNSIYTQIRRNVHFITIYYSVYNNYINGLCWGCRDSEHCSVPGQVRVGQVRLSQVRLQVRFLKKVFSRSCSMILQLFLQPCFHLFIILRFPKKCNKFLCLRFPGNSFQNLIFLISEDAMHQITEYGRQKKPFFIKIPNFWAQADKFWGIWGIFG